MYGRIWISFVFGWQAIKLKLLLHVQNIEPCILNLILKCGLSFWILVGGSRSSHSTFFLFWSPKAEIFPRIFVWIWNVRSIWQFKSFCTILAFHWFCLPIKCEFTNRQFALQISSFFGSFNCIIICAYYRHISALYVYRSSR